MDYLTTSLTAADYSNIITVGNDALSISIHCIFTGLNAADGVLVIETNNDNGAVWQAVPINSDGDLSVTVATGTSSEFFAIDRCAVGQYIRIRFTRTSVTAGSIRIVTNEAHT